MHVIRFNWKLINKLLVVGSLIYALVWFVHYVINIQEPVLRYDPERQQFVLNLRQLAGYSSVKNVDYFELSAENDYVDIDEKYVFGRPRTSKLQTYERVFLIRSVTIHYGQVLPKYWSTQIENAVKLGANTIKLDVVWNQHEQIDGMFNFDTFPYDIDTFIELVASYQMFLIVRIDPYIHCSHYDMGGLPSWLLGHFKEGEFTNLPLDYQFDDLLNINNPKLRFYYQRFLIKLLTVISKYQMVNKGPIIGVCLTLDNNSDEYVTLVQRTLSSQGFIEALMSIQNLCEINSKYNSNDDTQSSDSDCSHLNVYLPVKSREKSTSKGHNQQRCLPDFYYWNAKQQDLRIKVPFNDKNVKKRQNLFHFKQNLLELLKTYRSFSIENFNCLTLFDINTGTHYDALNKRQLLLSTSVLNNDYICLVDENQHLTDKFWQAHDLINGEYHFSLLRRKLPPLLKNKTRKSHSHIYLKLSQFTLDKSTPLKMSYFLPFPKMIKSLSKVQPLVSKTEDLYLNWEYLNHKHRYNARNHGFILFKQRVELVKDSFIFIKPAFVRDNLIVICDMSYRVLYLDKQQHYKDTVQLTLGQNCSDLYLFIENIGRQSDKEDLKSFAQERKGLLNDSISFKKDKKSQPFFNSTGWEIYFFDFTKAFLNHLSLNSNWLSYNKENESIVEGPFMSFATFNVKTVGQHATATLSNNDNGIYLLLNDWQKGIVFVNGNIVGRYWTTNAGSLCTLYIPSALLNKGLNELLVLELAKAQTNTVYFTTNHVYI